MKVLAKGIAETNPSRSFTRTGFVAVVFPIVLVLVFVLSSSAFGDVRRAFVVGIDRYDYFSEHNQLNNAVSDADAVADRLTAVAFDEVTVLHNLDRFQFNSAWQVFLDSVGEGDTVTFFFSGHGIAIDGKNYLLPRSMPDLQPGRSELIKSESVSINNLLLDLKKRNPAVTVMILDACRNDPFAAMKSRDAGLGGGLAGANDPPSGTFIMYSAAAGMVALDSVPGENGPHSVYTRHLLDLIPRTDLGIAAMARELRQRVNETTKKTANGFLQSPAYYDGLVGDFCLAGCEGDRPDNPNELEKVATPDPAKGDVRSIAAADRCPAYTASSLYRPRKNRITIEPNSAWESAIADAGPDSEILLGDGEYQLSSSLVSIDQPNITIRSASGNRDAVWIRGAGYDTNGQGFMIMGPNITIADLSISEIRDHAISISPVEGARETHIYNVHLYDIATQHIKGNSGAENLNGVVACSSIGYTPNGPKGDNIGAISIQSGVDWTIRDNYIYNINGDGTGCNVDVDCGTYQYRAPAINLLNKSRGSIVERNSIVDSFRGISFGLGTQHTGGVIRNNFIYQSVAGDAGIELWTASDALVEHNTVLLAGGYRGAIEYRDSANLTIRNNLLTAPPLDRLGNRKVKVEGNISDATPAELARPASPHLSPDSRAIGAGVSSDVATDIDGDKRAGRSDVGADHFEE